MSQHVIFSKIHVLIKKLKLLYNCDDFIKGVSYVS